jgi:hypothetical protein
MRNLPLAVLPAQAGIQKSLDCLGSRLRVRVKTPARNRFDDA